MLCQTPMSQYGSSLCVPCCGCMVLVKGCTIFFFSMISKLSSALPVPGLPWSGKNFLKMNFIPGQGKIREIWIGLGKSGKSQGIRKLNGYLVFRNYTFTGQGERSTF